MTRLLDRVQNPQRGLECVHIAGSKGKGSTALMVEALLEGADIRTGTYTSPHLERWTERIRIGGRESTLEQLAEALDVLEPHVSALTSASPDNPPSFFDVLTAAALWLFRRHGVEIAIIEAGIGGRYDATNIIDPVVACITSVELEHTDKLGADLASIAHHKAGILKAGARAVLGTLPGAAAEIIEREIGSIGCSAIWAGGDFRVESRALGTTQRVVFHAVRERLAFTLNHPARTMAENAALALACVLSLPGFTFATLSEAARALELVTLPGRAEVLQTEPWIVVDSAHTPASIAALADLLDGLPCRKRHFLISISVDKPATLLAPLVRPGATVTVTSPEPLRSTPAGQLAETISKAWPELDVHAEPEVAAALAHARSKLTPDALLCVTGSTYVAGAARGLLTRD